MSPAAPDPSVPKTYEVLGEHYRLARKLGEGAFGMVYLARHELLEQDFAVKVLKPELCEDENLRQRFLDEARALIRFSHPNVVQLRHVGEQNGRLYLVMDLVQGLPLNDLLRKEGALEEQRAINLITQVLSGLEAAHAAGIVHRDLKPGNLIVDKRPDGAERIRILDFGLSKLSPVGGAAGAHRSVTGAIIGTLAYMSPEQLSGERDIDARSDIFASGLILHEMLNGRHPYPGESGIVVAAKLLREPVPDLDPKRSANLLDSTKAALKQALERDRDARFSTAFAFAQALQGAGPPSDTSRVTTIQQAREALARAEAQAAKGRRSGKSKAPKILIGAGALVVIAALAFFLLGRKGRGGAAAPNPGEVARSTAANPGRGSTSPTPTTPASPTPASTTPGSPTPHVSPTPAATTPGATSPAPTSPASTTPSSTPAAPTSPGATAPGPGTPGTTSPTPSPGVAETPSQPAPVSGETTPGRPPEVTPTSVTPTPPEGATPEAAAALVAKGEWEKARLAWQGVLAQKTIDVPAIRGAAEAWLAEADSQARHGDVSASLATLDRLIAWLTGVYKSYEKLSASDPEKLKKPLGFVATHRGEAETQKGRWLEVAGDQKAADDAFEQARKDLDVAWQFLDRDGVNYWDFLLRRAEWKRLQDDYQGTLDDLALTTKVNSDEVPPRMWVADFTGLRREAERLFFEGASPLRRPPRHPVAPRKDFLDAARATAAKALHQVQQGVSWTHQRHEDFTRDQWLEAARVIVVNDMVAKPDVNRNAWAGLMKWYLQQASAQPAPPWESEDLAKARLLPLDAGLALLDSKVLDGSGRQADAAAKRKEAVQLAREAVERREEIAKAGGPLPDPFPYEMLAYVLGQDGRQAEASEALKKAREVAQTNPE